MKLWNLRKLTDHRILLFAILFPFNNKNLRIKSRPSHKKYPEANQHCHTVSTMVPLAGIHFAPRPIDSLVFLDRTEAAEKAGVPAEERPRGYVPA